MCVIHMSFPHMWSLLTTEPMEKIWSWHEPKLLHIVEIILNSLIELAKLYWGSGAGACLRPQCWFHFMPPWTLVGVVLVALKTRKWPLDPQPHEQHRLGVHHPHPRLLPQRGKTEITLQKQLRFSRLLYGETFCNLQTILLTPDIWSKKNHCLGKGGCLTATPLHLGIPQCVLCFMISVY